MAQNKLKFFPAFGIWIFWGIVHFVSTFTFLGNHSTGIDFETVSVLQSIFMAIVILLTTWAYVRAYRNRYTKKDFLTIGIFWFILYCAVEFAFFVPFGNSLPMLIEQCNIFKGHTWILAPMTALCAPYVYSRIYAKRAHPSPQEDTMEGSGVPRSESTAFTVFIIIAAIVYSIHLFQVLFFWGQGFAEWYFTIASPVHIFTITVIGLGILTAMTPRLRRNVLIVASGKAATARMIYSIETYFVAATIAYLAISSTNRSHQQKELESLFKEVIANPIPSGVKLTGGHWFSWLDSFEDLAFTIEREKFNDFIATYTKVPESQIDKGGSPFFSKGAGSSHYYKEIEYKKGHYYTIYLSWDDHAMQAFASVNEGKYSTGHTAFVINKTAESTVINDTREVKKENKPSPPPR